VKNEVSLSAAAKWLLRFQSTGPPPGIDGMWLKPLKKHRSENGWFMEHLRITEGAVEGLASYLLQQLSVSEAAPGAGSTSFTSTPRKGRTRCRRL
jgi:dTDP-4-dehydrorhamnose 3,5-epimerase